MIATIPETILPAIITVATGLAILHFQRTWCLTQPRKATTSDYLYKMARLTHTSEFEVFRKSAEGWPVNANMIETDFNAYLQTGITPYYVNDYIRKNKVHIDGMRIPLC
jgi:hypothetical protein